MDTYEKPQISELGSLTALTEQQMNKIGPQSDIFTDLTNGAAIGSLVPVQG